MGSNGVVVEAIECAAVGSWSADIAAAVVVVAASVGAAAAVAGVDACHTGCWDGVG